LPAVFGRKFAAGQSAAHPKRANEVLVTARKLGYSVTETLIDRINQFPVVLRRVIPLLALLGVATVIVVRGLGAGLMMAAGLMLLAAIFLAWSSVQSLTGEAEMSLDEALGLAVPTFEEERKRAILRALKDLEYERGVGKVSEADYAELSEQYRAEAKVLLRALENQDKPSRERAARLLEKKLRNAGLGDAEGHTPDSAEADDDGEATDAVSAQPTEHDDEDVPDSDAADRGPSASSVAAKAAPSRACGKCKKRNDLDAAFCKKCGAALAGDGERLCQACPAVYADDEENCPQCGVPHED
jgi:RNA polymerase subunit RPABC4/transcription elongation factor Spt4